jgi:aspartyl-tRNA(Asn)/glutamyl-tRNA(Gln) amidotransferase subunit A
MAISYTAVKSSDDGILVLSATELRAAFTARRLSPVELVHALSARIAEAQPLVNAFTALCLDEAVAEAEAAERAFRPGGRPRPLEGIPIGVKDFFDTAALRTAVGSPIFRDRVPTVDAEAVRRSREAGAILIGKTATHEFGWGITTDSPHFGVTRNPWAPDRVAGGSSGGSAAALASGQTPLAIGSDTGGSIRIPAAFCGIVGMKPTWGRVSCDGAFPLAPSLDHPGAMARTPADAALLLDVLAGAPDPGHRVRPEPDPRLDGTRIGLCPDLHLAPLPPDQRRAYDAAVHALGELGARLEEVGLAHADRIMPTFVTIQQAEALHTHRRAGLYPQRSDEYGPDVRARLHASEAVGLDDYLDALEERRRIRRRFEALFDCFDALLTPVTGASPVPIGESAVENADGSRTPFRDAVMPYTVPQDLVGLPACAVRAGFDRLGLPVGVQITGATGADDRVLAVAQALFAATDGVQDRWPVLPRPE